MNSDNSWSSIARAVSALNQAGSITTRTHIQKLLYFATAWKEPKTYGFEFVLHLHGPYSYELDREIMAMEAFGKVAATPDSSGYGARYTTDPTEDSTQLDRLAAWLGPKSSRQLEALATAEFIASRGSTDVVEEVREIKPHLTPDEVRHAIKEVAANRP